jgi:hypothetical protein
MAETIKGINREVWDILKKIARAKDAGFTYFTNHPKFHWMTYKEYISRPDDFMGDEGLVAKLVGVGDSTANNWHCLCDTPNPVHGRTYLNKVNAVLSKNETASCTVHAKVVPKAPVSPVVPERKIVECAVIQKEVASTLPLDALTDEELLAVADRAFTIIDQRKIKREKKAAAMRQIKQLADEAGLSLAEIANAA